MSTPKSVQVCTRSLFAAAVTAGLVVTLTPGAAHAATTTATVNATTAQRETYPTIATDSFTRTSGSGWGSAETGGSWVQNGAASQYTVDGKVGSLSVARAGSTISSYLSGVSATDTDTTITFSADKAQTGSGTHLLVSGRHIGSLDYAAKIRLNADGTATLALVDGTTTLAAVNLPGTYAANDQITVRLQVFGTSPTTVRAKAWRTGSTEPTSWQVSTTSSTSGLQAKGTVGVSAYLSGNVTNAPIAYRFDDLKVTTAQPVLVPNAVPTAKVASKVSDLAAHLDGSASTDSDGTIASYTWNFGDGTTGTGAVVDHAYAKAGTYTASLTVTDNDGDSASASTQVVAVAPNQAPVASFTAKTTDLTAAVDGSGSSDPDGKVASYAWDFGDGSTGTGAAATHAYAKAGTYTVKLTVTDDRGATASTTNTVTAVAPNQAPVSSFTASTKDLTATLDGTGSSDPDGKVASYAWSFGDGSTGTGSTATHTYAKAGTYTVTLAVTDDRGATTSSSKTVTAVEPNKAPLASFTASAQDLTASVDASGSSDPDGSIASYAWDFGDGATGTGSKATHAYAKAGTYTVTLTVTDDAGAKTSSTSSVTVTAPVASSTLAKDDFSTARSNGWGDAQTGGTWTLAGAASNYSVSGSSGRQVITTAGSTRTASLTSVSSTDTNTTVTIAADKATAGGASQMTVIGRQVGTDSYAARIKWNADGTTQLSAMENGTALSTASLAAYKAGDQLNVRLEVTGTSPTTVRAKVWAAGSAEPTAWQVSGTGSLASLQKAGYVGLSSYMSSSASVAPLTVSYRDLKVTGTSDQNLGGGTEKPEVKPGYGVPEGTTIQKTVDGNLTITDDNTVIDGWDIRGYVTIKAKNVLIKNSYIRGTAVPQVNDLLRVQGDAYSVTVENSTLAAQTESANQDGVKGWNFTLRGVDISHVIDPIHIHGPNVLIENSWLHDNSHYEQDPNWNNTPSHDDSIQIQQGSNITIRNNTIQGSHNAAVMLTQDAGAVSNLTISGNSIDNGACSINIKDASIGAPKNVSITDNTFGRGQVYKNCAVRVPTAYALTMTNNVWVDGGIVARTNI
ncbi:PKD domain-containing protein [Cellulomonas alba]|uniref:PKD domain-containing protein n=1 Tax=Cellulomonas alba TaxID=3053467 RepID=A0ABT7SJ32_9CELL|nr:PKD domain-containing protein [Cellulomonas alba]MDM7855569.1 PKD domain-containing protein [Cellulomonas alba]